MTTEPIDLDLVARIESLLTDHAHQVGLKSAREPAESGEVRGNAVTEFVRQAIADRDIATSVAFLVSVAVDLAYQAQTFERILDPNIVDLDDAPELFDYVEGDDEMAAARLRATCEWSSNVIRVHS